MRFEKSREAEILNSFRNKEEAREILIRLIQKATVRYDFDFHELTSEAEKRSVSLAGTTEECMALIARLKAFSMLSVSEERKAKLAEMCEILERRIEKIRFLNGHENI